MRLEAWLRSDVNDEYLLHLSHELIYRPGFYGESTAIANGDGPGYIGRIAVPFTAGVDEQDLWIEFFRLVVGEGILVLVIMGFHWAPCKVPVIAAIVQSRCTIGSGYDGQISLMNGTAWDNKLRYTTAASETCLPFSSAGSYEDRFRFSLLLYQPFSRQQRTIKPCILASLDSANDRLP